MELLFQLLDELDDFIAAARHVLARYLGLRLERGRRGRAVEQRRPPIGIGERTPTPLAGS